MAPKSLLFLGLLFAIILVISSDLVSASRPEPEVAKTEGDVKVDGWEDGHHHHHCHYPHCREKAETNDHHEEAKAETRATKSNEAEDGHHEHRCEHWPHC
ncbi:hypothetical protein CDL12_25111 [Handroanthus impetiginosus]|uniref:Uncharacterized protein n=1 Tax=Handroanthus impetiginosus TaxID=429701 RepID=A0A2G9GB04_9LAMI|nr:hypothetical protein CDL12_25111 [Handroanthus impetiginosus]